MRLMFVARMIDRVAGGVERMIVTIMNAMVARGHEVDLFTWDLQEPNHSTPWRLASLGTSLTSVTLLLRPARR